MTKTFNQEINRFPVGFFEETNADAHFKITQIDKTPKNPILWIYAF